MGEVMSVKLSVSDDGLFRAIFGHESSTHFLTGLVNAVLRNAGDPPVRALEIKNPFQLKDLANQKEPVLDIKAQDDRGHWFDVEIQVVMHENFRERILYYWSRTYSQELQQGTDYYDLRPVFGIIFTKFPIWPKQPEILYDAFQIGSKYDLARVYSDHLKLHFITIPGQTDGLEHCLHDTELRQWLKILNYPNLTSEEEMTTLATENPLIGEAYERTKTLMADSQVQYYMEARLKHALDEATRRREIELKLRDTYNQGVTRGLA
ncbi:MAG: Rpn family recombination-promoting nuclease/putative transposase, partial [Planctomycetia bacterium]|nr:Rpn family recombination-promoting nuclease/putative transposase [Planctomycetia bacterium]